MLTVSKVFTVGAQRFPLLCLLIVLLLSACSGASHNTKADDKTLALIDELKDSDKQVRTQALKMLGERRDPRAINAIALRLKADSWAEREAAVFALAEMRDHLALDPLFFALDDSSKFVQDSASKGLDKVVVQLGKKADPRMLRVITARLSDTKSVVRHKAADLLKLAIRSLRYVAASEYLKFILDALQNKHVSARVAAAEIMRTIDHPDVYKPLLQALSDENREVREAAATSLANLTHPKRRETIVNAMAAGDHFVVVHAAKLLSHYRRGDFRADTLSMLKHENAKVREGGVLTLLAWEDSAYIHDILPLLKDPDAAVRLAAGQALDKLGWVAVTEQEIAQLCIAMQDWERCRDLKPKVLFDPLLQAVQDNNADVRAAATDMLLELDWKPKNAEQRAQLCVMQRDWDTCVEIGPVAVPALVRELDNIDLDTRLAIIDALGKIGDDTAAPAIARFIKDDDQEIRYAVVENLGKLRSRKTLESLILGLDDSSQYVRRAALKALTDNMDLISNIKDIRVVQPIIRAVKDNNSNVRKVAVTILGRINNMQVVAHLISALNDVDAEVRDAATQALKSQRSPTSMEALVESLSNTNPEARKQAVLALAEFKNERLLKHFNLLRDDPNLEVRIAAIQAIGKIPGPNVAEILAESANDNESKVRLEVAKALPGHESQKATATLIKLGSDDNKDVRNTAREQLLHSGWKPANNLEKVLQCIYQKTWYLCDEFGIDAVLPLVAELEFNEVPDRPGIIRALGKIGNIQAVDGILKFMALTQWENKGNDDVTEALLNANRALLQIGKQATSKLLPYLRQWYMGPMVVDLLAKYDWHPGNELDAMYFNIAKRQAHPIIQKWKFHRKVLLNNLKSKDAGLQQFTATALIGLGQEDSLDELVEYIKLHGNPQMAELYLNSKNQRLVSAARDWIEDQGLVVDDKREGTHLVEWGRM